MKKIIFILLLGFFGAQQIWAQARIFNTTNEKLVVSDLKGLTEVVVNPNGSAVATFLPSDGVAKFNLARYEGFNKVNLGEATRLAKRGKIALKDLSLDDGSASEAGESRESERETATVQQFGYAGSGAGGSRSGVQTRPVVVPESGIVLSNQSSYRLTVLDGVFKGAALASGQVSRINRRVPTGKLTFSVYFDPEEDSISSGRNHRWAVINKIIVEDQDSLNINDTDLSQVSSGEQIKKAVKNNFNIDFLIVAGNNAGEVVPARKMTQLDLAIGWNYIPVEYMTKEGHPVRSILLLMVNNSKRPIVVNRRSDAELDSVNPNEIVFSNSK